MLELQDLSTYYISACSVRVTVALHIIKITHTCFVFSFSQLASSTFIAASMEIDGGFALVCAIRDSCY